MADIQPTPSHEAAIAARRQMLKLGAIGAAAVVTVRPAMAQAAVSVLNCQIQIPDPASGTSYIAADGSLVPHGTAGAFAAPARAYTGEEVKAGLAGGSLPYTPSDASQAYLNYIRKLRSGQSGFTCFASIQMPR
jgi:hypothetical protein